MTLFFSLSLSSCYVTAAPYCLVLDTLQSSFMYVIEAINFTRCFVYETESLNLLDVYHSSTKYLYHQALSELSLPMIQNYNFWAKVVRMIDVVSEEKNVLISGMSWTYSHYTVVLIKHFIQCFLLYWKKVGMQYVHT